MSAPAAGRRSGSARATLASLLPDLRDVVTLAGIGLASYGAWLIFPPAAFVVAGVALFYLGVWGH